ncbi:unnamed protein product, partial [Pylaiella littoralis]
RGQWPAATRYNPIFLQQDNARPHLINNDPDLLEACSSDGFDIRLINQPPNSPDTNILDLGFFASIQSLQDHRRPHRRGRDRMGDGVAGQARQCVDFAPGLHGANLALRWGDTYKLPHLGKDKAARAG